MTTRKLSERVRGFLEASFSEASIDEGYYFVTFRAKAWRLVREEGLQVVVDKMCTGTCWLIAVNLDPRPCVNAQEIEEREVNYSPDWNVHETYTQFILEFKDRVDIQELLRAEGSPGALVLVSPSQGIALNVNMRQIFAISELTLTSFIEEMQDYLEPPERDYSLF